MIENQTQAYISNLERTWDDTHILRTLSLLSYKTLGVSTVV